MQINGNVAEYDWMMCRYRTHWTYAEISSTDEEHTCKWIVWSAERQLYYS